MKGILVILKTKNIMDNNNKNGKKLDTGINCGDQTVKSEKEDGETKETGKDSHILSCVNLIFLLGY